MCMPKKQVMKCIYSGAVCETYVFQVPANVDPATAKLPQPKPISEEERLRHLLGISRRHHTQLCNANWTPDYLFCTLTFDDDHLPSDLKEAKRIAVNYRRRLKYAYPDAVIFTYLGRGRKTNRIHIHIVCYGIPEDKIREKWKCGDIDKIEPLRKDNYYNGVNHGQDYTELANYLFDHWSPEQGGRHWSNTKNVRQPEIEKTVEVERKYSVQNPPEPPKGYILVECRETEYGLLYCKYVRNPDEPVWEQLTVDGMYWEEGAEPRKPKRRTIDRNYRF